MEVIGVLQLDPPGKELDHSSSPDILDSAGKQFALLKQCHTVKNWIIMAKPSVLDRLEERLGHADQLKYVKTPGQDALDTFFRAAERYLGNEENGSQPIKGAFVVRVTPGPTLLEAREVDAMLSNHMHEDFDFSSNNMMDDGPAATIEIMNLDVLNEAWREALLPDDRDLITPYIARQHQRLNLGTYNPPNSVQSMRHRIDTIRF